MLMNDLAADYDMFRMKEKPPKIRTGSLDGEIGGLGSVRTPAISSKLTPTMRSLKKHRRRELHSVRRHSFSRSGDRSTARPKR
jgi:hypothetical protein